MTLSAKGDELPPHLTNAFFEADRISCACDTGSVAVAAPESIYRDPHFGNTWSWTPPLGAALYGRTEDLPSTPIDAMGSGDYLRVPYRRIPVINIHSAQELLALATTVHSKDPAVRGVWRGQARQYWLPRSDEDKLRLYGDAAIKEPSLPPSASRSSVYFPDLFQTWAGLLDIFMGERSKHLGELYLSQRARLDYERRNFCAGYNYRLYGFATAQHYGVPSVGLDVSNNIRIALFFALHRFATDKATGAMTMTRATDADDPIIYGMGGFQHDLFDDEQLAPGWLQCSRPKAQDAMFFGTGWGASCNKAADRIYIALRLVGHTHWKSPLTAHEVFPAVTDDPFLAFLLDARDRFGLPMIRDILSYIYFVP